ncbi:hypothetical protein H9W95_09155 [Flavobacterium lindanitolerans]|nr:hypothetical protein [Flavobacterium lindanitolerans]
MVRRLIRNAPNIEFVFLKDFEMLKQLLGEAHINLILSFQRSGTKLKLLNSLFRSRFCIINENIIDDEIVSDFCIKTDSKEKLISLINFLKSQPYLDGEKKKTVLEEYLNDRANAQILSGILESLNR